MERAQALPKKKKRFRNLPLFLIALPGVIYLIINNYVPMFGILRITALLKAYLAVTGADLRILSSCSRQRMPGS